MKAALLLSTLIIQSSLYSIWRSFSFLVGSSRYRLEAGKADIENPIEIFSMPTLNTFASIPKPKASLLQTQNSASQTSNCNKIDWASWGAFTGRSAKGTINNKGSRVNVMIRSSFDFTYANDIWGYDQFRRYASPMPNTTTPTLTWTHKPGGKVTMCFSKTVKDPVLMIASLGRNNASDRVTLRFSKPYVVVFNGGGMNYHSNTTLTGMEGYAIVRFKGDFTCVTIAASKFEEYTHLTWGLPACEDVIKPKPIKVARPIVLKPVQKPTIKIPKPVEKVEQKTVIPPTPTPKVNNIIKESSLRVQIWDFDCMDYDSVSLKFNGIQVGPTAILLPLYKRDSPEYTYTMDLRPGDNTLEIYSISDGMKPLTSIGLLIMYHDRRGKVYYKLKSRETIVIHL